MKLFIVLTALTCIISCSKSDNFKGKTNADSLIIEKRLEVAPVATSQAVALGSYQSVVDFQGGEYALAYDFSAEGYTSSLMFDGETVFTCKGQFSFANDTLYKTNRMYHFLRSEEPSEPVQKENLAQLVKNVTDSTFDMQVIKESEEGFDSTFWVSLKKSVL